MTKTPRRNTSLPRAKLLEILEQAADALARMKKSEAIAHGVKCWLMGGSENEGKTCRCGLTQLLDALDDGRDVS